MTVSLNLRADTERVLRQKAIQSGLPLEVYLEEIADQAARTVRGEPAGGYAETTEFERGLEELSDSLPLLPSLPADFSRADIYGEHS